MEHRGNPDEHSDLVAFHRIGRTSASDPFTARPIGERAVATMTALRMVLLVGW